MFDVRPVLYVIGLIVTVLGIAMVLPAIVSLALGELDAMVFLVAAVVTAFLGISLSLASRASGRVDLSIRQAFLLTALVWCFAAVFGGLPFMFLSTPLGFTDAVFEAMSGLTTTGSTVMVGLDEKPAGVLLWRGLLQGLGGIGIIVMAVAFLPVLKIGGMQLFRTESSDRSDKVSASVSEQAFGMIRIYLLIAAASVVALLLAGNSLLDAVVHALAAVSTGGFANYDASIGKYDDPVVEAILIVTMLLGGGTFTAYVRGIRGDVSAVWRDSQHRAYVLTFLAFALLLTLWQAVVNGRDLLPALRHSAFNVVSILTTTGFATEDYSLWGPLPLVAFLFLTFIGGCTGSTSGAIKVFRFQVVGSAVAAQFSRSLYPHAVRVPTYQGRPVSDAVLMSVLSFVGLYMLTFCALSLGLSLCGLDFVTAITGAATSLGNVGPGLGEIIGPAGNFAPLPASAKWLLTLGMLLGRLELVTLLILFTPRFWRE